MNEEIIEYLQSDYEDILVNHWHKVLDIRELRNTNKNNHPLRIKSIYDREKELETIIAKKKAYELLYDDYIAIPKWYIDILKKHNIGCENE